MIKDWILEKCYYSVNRNLHTKNRYGFFKSYSSTMWLDIEENLRDEFR